MVVVQVVKVSAVPEHELDEVDEYINWSHGKVLGVIQVAKAPLRWLALGGIQVCEICFKTRWYPYLRTAVE